MESNGLWSVSRYMQFGERYSVEKTSPKNLKSVPWGRWPSLWLLASVIKGRGSDRVVVIVIVVLALAMDVDNCASFPLPRRRRRSERRSRSRHDKFGCTVSISIDSKTAIPSSSSSTSRKLRYVEEVICWWVLRTVVVVVSVELVVVVTGNGGKHEAAIPKPSETLAKKTVSGYGYETLWSEDRLGLVERVAMAGAGGGERRVEGGPRGGVSLGNALRGWNTPKQHHLVMGVKGAASPRDLHLCPVPWSCSLVPCLTDYHNKPIYSTRSTPKNKNELF